MLKYISLNFLFLSDFSVTTDPFNTSLFTEAPINVYFIGPLGSFVWVPFAIILFIFFIFFTYSFIVYHADNKDKYVARRNRMMLDVYSADQLSAAYSEHTLNDILPKRRLRPFALRMDLKQVLKEIWRCHGANPRKLQALFMQMQMQMMQSQMETEAAGDVNRSVTSLTLANQGIGGKMLTGNPQLNLTRRNSTMSNASEGSPDSMLRDRRQGRQLPATPPLTSQRRRPILQKAASLQSSLTRSPSVAHSVSFQMPPSVKSSANVPPLPSNMAVPPPRPPLPNPIALPSISSQLSNFRRLNMSMGMMSPKQNDYFQRTFSHPAALSAENEMDLDCDSDFISEGSPKRSAAVSEKKREVNVLLIPKLYKKH